MRCFSCAKKSQCKAINLDIKNSRKARLMARCNKLTVSPCFPEFNLDFPLFSWGGDYLEKGLHKWGLLQLAGQRVVTVVSPLAREG